MNAEKIVRDEYFRQVEIYGYVGSFRTKLEGVEDFNKLYEETDDVYMMMWMLAKIHGDNDIRFDKLARKWALSVWEYYFEKDECPAVWNFLLTGEGRDDAYREVGSINAKCCVGEGEKQIRRYWASKPAVAASAPIKWSAFRINALSAVDDGHDIESWGRNKSAADDVRELFPNPFTPKEV